nr:hypothetical protein [Tanacetum cinerariifolium]
MAAPVNFISSDSFEENVGSHAPRVILFGTIPTSIPVILVVPAEVPIAHIDPIVAPEADSESEPAEQRPERHESLASLFDRPYRTHPNGLHKLLTARKRVGLFPARRLTWRRVSHRSSDRYSSPYFTSDSFLLVHLWTLPHIFLKFIFRFIIRLIISSFIRSATLSTLYPPMTTESSLDSFFERSLDSSSPFVVPSHNRCRSLTTLVPSSTPFLRSITPSLVDLPPRKRFKDLYSSEVSGEEHMKMGTAEEETIADLGISEGVGAHTKDGIDLGVEFATSYIREDEEEFEPEASAGGMMEIVVDPLATGDISEPTGRDAPDLEGTLYDISHYMSEVPLDRITEFKTAQRQLEAGQLVASEERTVLANRVRSLGWENLRVQALLCIERDRVDSLRHHMALSQEEFCQIHRDRNDTRRRLRRLESLVERRLGFRR